jgi:hypothetical protein
MGVLVMMEPMSSSFKSTDSQSGFRALGPRALALMSFPSSEYNIESDMISRISGQGLTITEVPTTVRYDVPHKHKKHPFAHGMDILTHLVGLIGYKRPLLSFGIPGVVLTTFGFVAGILTFTEYYSGGDFHYIIFVMGIVAIFLGLLLLSSALILNSLLIIIREIRE